MPTFSTFAAWIDAPVTTKVYLVTLTLRYVSGGTVLTEKLYLSNASYNTGSIDAPANTEFIAVLQDQDIPSFLQELSSSIFGIGIPSFGELRITNVDGEFDGKLPPTREWEGGEALIELTGPKVELAYANRKTIFKGVIGKILEATDNHIRMEIFSRLQDLKRKMFPTTTFTAANGELALAPVLYGHGQNIEPILKDATTTTDIIYKVTGAALTDITAVRDNGEALTVTTQWTKDLPNGEFALKQQSKGKITCDAKGKATKYPGDYSEQRFDFIFDAIESFGGISSDEIDAASFSQGNVDVSGPSWRYVKEQISVLDFAVSLLHPVIGYLFADRAGKFFAGIIKTAVGSSKLTLTDANLIPLSGGVSIGEGASGESGDQDITSIALAEALYARVRLLYDQNGTVQSEDSIGASGDVDPSTKAGRERRAWLAQEWRSTEKENTGTTQGRNLYPNAGELEIESFFRNKSDADNFAQEWLDKFGVSRRVITCRATVQPLQTELHDVVRINRSRFFTNVDTRVIRYRENYAENIVEMGLLVI